MIKITSASENIKMAIDVMVDQKCRGVFDSIDFSIDLFFRMTSKMKHPQIANNRIMNG
jgi:hypothetical protein